MSCILHAPEPVNGTLKVILLRAQRLDIQGVQNHIHEKAGLLCVTPLKSLLVSNWLDNTSSGNINRRRGERSA